mgnify:CR=1 FL=1
MNKVKHNDAALQDMRSAREFEELECNNTVSVQKNVGLTKKCESNACGAVIVAADYKCEWWEIKSTVFGVDPSDSSKKVALGRLRTLYGPLSPQTYANIILVSDEPLFGPFVEQYIGLDLALNTKADVVVDPKGIIDMPDESVGFVLSTQVLEHVEDPKSYLKEACRILQKDGKLILSTHGYWMFHPDPTDFWRWTSTGLQKIVKEAGVEIVYFEGILARSSMGLQLFQDGLLFKFPKAIRPLWSMLLQPFIIFFDKIAGNKSRREDACTFILVAKKM